MQVEVDECQLRAERLYGRLTELRAKLFGEHVDLDSPESAAQIARIAGFLRGSQSLENQAPRIGRGMQGMFSLARERS